MAHIQNRRLVGAGGDGGRPGLGVKIRWSPTPTQVMLVHLCEGTKSPRIHTLKWLEQGLFCHVDVTSV